MPRKKEYVEIRQEHVAKARKASLQARRKSTVEREKPRPMTSVKKRKSLVIPRQPSPKNKKKKAKVEDH